jgi:predicted aconitase with swiveling domain
MHGGRKVTKVIKVGRSWGAVVEGAALVLSEGFSPRYDLDRWSGVISRIGHSAEGKSIRDRILIIPTAKGGVAGGWAFYDLLKKGIAPKAMLFGKLNPVMVQGAVLARMTIAEGWEGNLTEWVRTDDVVRLDPIQKTLTVLTK